jgi:hypothetical protein
MNELPDTAEALEAKETAHRVPWGYWLLFWGLIVWGVWYAWTYTPSLGGWSQSQAYEQSVDAAAAGASGGNIFATILFTAIPTIAAILLWVVASRRKPGKG